jgi:DNA-directed RNA polymerase beta' subunit
MEEGGQMGGLAGGARGRASWWSGYDLLSAILPPDLTVEAPGLGPAGLRVRRGRLLRGQLDKKGVRALTLAIYQQRTGRDAECFVFELQQLAQRFLATRGLTISLGDLTTTPEAQAASDARLRADVEAASASAAAAASADAQGEGEGEDELVRALDAACRAARARFVPRAASSSVCDAMVASGAKGSGANMVQMTVAVGQQMLGGARLDGGVSGGAHSTRARHAFQAHALAARGLILRPQTAGMGPLDVTDNAHAAREGVCATAQSTKETGYMLRKVVTGLRDVVAGPGGVVIDLNTHKVVCLTYGADALDGARVVPQQQQQHALELPFDVDSMIVRCQDAGPQRSGDVVMTDVNEVSDTFDGNRVGRHVHR